VAIGDTYVLRLFYTYYGQEMQNKFLYRQLDESGVVADQAEALVTAFLQLGDNHPIMTMQSQNCHWNAIQAENTLDSTEYFEGFLASASGNVSGTDMPPFTALKFKKGKTDKTFRTSTWAFGGCCQQFFGLAGAIDSAYQTTCDALALWLYEDLSIADAGEPDGTDGSWEPVLVKTNASPLVPDFYTRVSYVQCTGQTTQNTRKRWSGN